MDEYTQYLKLLSFVFGISTDVIHHYFEIRILNTLTFHMFLNNNKHILFNEYIPTVQCCQCFHLSVAAPNKRGCLKKDQFSSLFDSSGPAAPNHAKKSIHGSVSQYCLCSLSPVSNVSIDVMDITLVCALVRKCCPSIPGNPVWLETIRDTRNYLVHLPSGQLSSQEFENRWIILETAVINIAGVIGTTYQKTTRKHIAGLKMDTLSLEGVKDIIKDINDEAKQVLDTNGCRSMFSHICYVSFRIKQETHHVKCRNTITFKNMLQNHHPHVCDSTKYNRILSLKIIKI